MDFTPRTFDLGDVLTISDGHLVAARHMEAVYDILNYMTGDNLTTIGLLSAMPPCKAALLEQHPQLAEVVYPEGLDPALIPDWVRAQAAKYGESLPVTPLKQWDRRSVADDILDVMRINPNAEIIAVDPEGSQ